MKKLMIAAAIVCAAAFAQAAQIEWGKTTEASGLASEWASEGAWYGLYMLSDNVDVSKITAIDATSHALTIAGATASLIDFHVVNYEEWDGGVFAEPHEGAAADLNGKYYAIVLVDPSNKDYASAGVYSISGLSDSGGQGILSIDGTGDETMFSQTGSVFSVAIETSAAPEPTSGLLLLLGVAGLALKRRRA